MKKNKSKQKPTNNNSLLNFGAKTKKLPEMGSVKSDLDETLSKFF